ncbi:nuclear transport factor 2 family protein [Herbaspirillum sp. ST 5-3]|uniref:nuclear transport factor 2 family protein n=1 Tax=Oxalobacteraceae TaxID=75682 RepID=UPI001B3C12A4
MSEQTELNELIERYIAVWSETDAPRRRALIAQVFTEDADFLDPLTHAYGHDGIDAMIAAMQQRFPAHRVSRHGDIDALQDRVRFVWRLAPVDADAPDAMRAQGTDFGVVADGRLCKLTGFFDPMPEAPVQKKHGWSVDSFAAFWAKPNPALVPRALAPDVVGYWPGSEPVRGVDAYTQRIAELIAMVPDFRLEVAEHAANGDCVFIRWIARGSFDDAPFEFTGVDRVRVRDGLVAENRIFCDHPLIQVLAASHSRQRAAV